MDRFDHGGPRDRQGLLRRFSRGHGAPNLAGRGGDVAAEAGLRRQVLPRDDLALGLARACERLGRRFVQRNGLRALQLVERQMGQNQSGPRLRRIPGAELPQTPACVVARTLLGADTTHAHQTVVGPRLPRARLALGKVRRRTLGGDPRAAQHQTGTPRRESHEQWWPVCQHRQ